MTRTTIRDAQDRAWANKLAKGFCTDNVPQEFMLTMMELGEAGKAYWEKPDELPGELADVVIYVTGIASMCGIDLEKAITDKLAINESRTYATNANGRLSKVVL